MQIVLVDSTVLDVDNVNEEARFIDGDYLDFLHIRAKESTINKTVDELKTMLTESNISTIVVNNSDGVQVLNTTKYNTVDQINKTYGDYETAISIRIK